MPTLFIDGQRLEVSAQIYFDGLVGMILGVRFCSTLMGQIDEVSGCIKRLQENSQEIADPVLKQYFQDLAQIVQKGDEDDRRTLAEIAVYFRVPTPETPAEIRKLMNKFYQASHTNSVSLSLMAMFQQSLQTRGEFCLAMETAEERIVGRIKMLYPPIINSAYLQKSSFFTMEANLAPLSTSAGEALVQEVGDLINEAAEDLDAARAVRRLEKAIARNLPGIQHSSVFLTLGARYEDTGNITKAIESYTKAVELSGTNVHAYFFRGELYFQQGNYEQAREDLQKALSFESPWGLNVEDADRACGYLEKMKNQ